MSGDLSARLDSILTDPNMMAQIKALADTMTRGSEPQSTETSPPVPEKAEKTEVPFLPSLLSGDASLAKNMKNTKALLLALKPYLDERRCEKVDKMLQMLRLAEMAGYFKNLI